MTSRREFVTMGLAASALPFAASGLLASERVAATTDMSTVPLYKVIFDEGLAASRHFALEAGRRGASTYGIRNDDITNFWFHELDLRWREQPLAIAGLTQQGALFVLERLAWDRGMRVVFRAEHTFRGDGSIVHALSGPHATLQRGSALQGSGPQEWSTVMAGLVTQCAAGCSPSATTTITTASAQPGAATEPLHSWVIAPVRRS